LVSGGLGSQIINCKIALSGWSWGLGWITTGWSGIYGDRFGSGVISYGTEIRSRGLGGLREWSIRSREIRRSLKWMGDGYQCYLAGLL